MLFYPSFRHSDRFYPQLCAIINTSTSTEPTSILNEIVHLCVNHDATSRKFACFAVGNAAFHSRVLYPHLAFSIPYLLQDLEDEGMLHCATALLLSLLLLLLGY
jgi:fused-like protein